MYRLRKGNNVLEEPRIS